MNIQMDDDSATQRLEEVQVKGEDMSELTLDDIHIIDHASTNAAAPEVDAILQHEVLAPAALLAPKPTHRKIYRNASEIRYTPKRAIREGVKMVKSVADSFKMVSIGNKMRKEVWQREIQKLLEQRSPTTLIAVCGATGVGKSSILNAILKDNVVPTSGMRACTSVVTEISYHSKRTINADVHFLSEDEWRQELEVLLRDVIADSEGENVDPNGPAGIAWEKVHAVYPNIEYEQLMEMDAQQIVDLNPNIVDRILGTTKEISGSDSTDFGRRIAKYIDSEDHSPRLSDDEIEVESSQESGESMAGEPALWPLIRQVSIRCKAEALSTGAVLVDLPGVADANAARDSVAKNYMKRADCIWILAPITRAVSDKMAQNLLGDAFKMQLMNGNYDDHCITFIATKCDDVSCSEIIKSLSLRDDPKLVEIENRMTSNAKKISEYRKQRRADQKKIKSVKEEVRNLGAQCENTEAYLEALRNGKTHISKYKGKQLAIGVKRKTTDSPGKTGPSKKKLRGRLLSDNDSDEGTSDTNASERSGSESESHAASGSKPRSDRPKNRIVETEEDLEAKLAQCRHDLAALRQELEEVENRLQQMSDKESTLEKKRTWIQKEKDVFCSLQRSEYSRTALKEGFRTGLRELHKSADNEQDSNSSPSRTLRDYSNINLPVFTCSSRDYVRLTGQVEGDGDPSCFSHVNQTGIPDLQQWCHKLTVASCERTAHRFLSKFLTLSESIASYLGAGEVTEAQRKALRDRWASRKTDSNPMQNPQSGDSDSDEEVDQLQDDEECIRGIASQLSMEFLNLVDSCVLGLKNRFKNELADKCRDGVTAASKSAIKIVDKYAPPPENRLANGMYWSTYRATLRHHGVWRCPRFGDVDLNLEFVTPLAKSISQSWIRLFESDLFAPFITAVTQKVKDLLQEFEHSAPEGLSDRANIQGQKCLQEAQLFLRDVMTVAENAMTKERKEISRALAPHVQAQLSDAYDEAGSVKGTGAVARLKALFRGHVEEHKKDIFEGGADLIFMGLNKAATAVGNTLAESLASLAQRIELNLGVLWETVKPDPLQAQARDHMAGVITEVQGQLRLWMEAIRLLQEARARDAEDVEMEDA